MVEMTSLESWLQMVVVEISSVRVRGAEAREDRV